MMLKEKSNQRARIKAFAFLPLAILLVSAFARKDVNAVNIDKSPNKVTESLDVEQVPYVKDENIKSDSAEYTYTVTDVEEDGVVVLQDEDGKKHTATVEGRHIRFHSDSTKNIASTKNMKLQDMAVTTVGDMLQGKIANMDLLSSSDTSGTQMSIRIRGVSSLNAGKKPLIVIDDVPRTDIEISSDFDFRTATEKDFGTLVNIDPSDIKTITVLKDASATAIYGEKATNGVLLITTKKVYEEKFLDSIHTSHATKPLIEKISKLNAERKEMEQKRVQMEKERTKANAEIKKLKEQLNLFKKESSKIK